MIYHMTLIIQSLKIKTIKNKLFIIVPLIDNKELKKVSFNLSEYKKGWVNFHFLDKEHLYFSIAEHYDIANPLTSSHSIYRVKIGTEEIEYVKIIIGENIGWLIDEFLYTFDEDNKISMSKLN